MNISAHDFHNKFNTVSNSAVTSSTPAWGHAWSSQQNVTPAIVKATGGTYALEVPLAEEDVPATPVKRGPGRPRKVK